MQIADTYANRGLPPSTGGGGSSPDFASQLREQLQRQKRILFWRTVGAWWYPIVLIPLGCALAIVLGQTVGLTYPLQICVVLLGLPVLVLIIKRVELGLLFFVAGTSAIAPKLVSLKSLDIYPSQILIALLFCIILVQAAFRVRKISLPSLRATWPQIGLLVVGIVANFIVQLTWTRGVPHKLNNNPIIYDEILGSLVFSFPLMVYFIVTMIVQTNERLIKYTQRLFLLIGVFVAFVVLYDFRRIGGNIYTFRFSEPHIAWMSLRAIAQVLALACMLAYARFLYSTTWPQRVLYCVITLLCLSTIILTLQNSWWLEVGVALVIMTIIYSRRLLIFYIMLILPLLPLLKAEYAKLQSVKTDDLVRLIIWTDSLRVWSKQPVLGVGPGNFWAYDQVFTNLPRALRNCNSTGLCVAHNGYLQILGEEGPLGLFFFLAFPAVMIILACMLYRRAYVPRKRSNANFFASFAGLIGLDLANLPAAKKELPTWSGKDVLFLLTGLLLPVLLFFRAFFVSPARFWRGVWRLFADDGRSQRHEDRMLALVCIGLTAGSMVGDFFAGGFFIPPRQIAVLAEMPQVVTSWIIWGLVMYRDQKWRMACKQAAINGERPIAYPIEGVNK
ncbi:MAG TPA: hypothetical protein DEV72_14850 [Ktedonobacter sp.]|nr:hypothetical protein [Ktedonobacter sp.]